MNPIKYRQTIVNISQNARKNAKVMYGEDLAALMVASMKNFETPSTKAATKWQRFKDHFRTHSKLSINVDTDKNGEFIMQTNRQIGHLMFTGKIVKVNFLKTLDSMKYFEKLILESKEGILKKLNDYNFNKNFFKS